MEAVTVDEEVICQDETRLACITSAESTVTDKYTDSGEDTATTIDEFCVDPSTNSEESNYLLGHSYSDFCDYVVTDCTDKINLEMCAILWTRFFEFYSGSCDDLTNWETDCNDEMKFFGVM